MIQWIARGVRKSSVQINLCYVREVPPTQPQQHCFRISMLASTRAAFRTSFQQSSSRIWRPRQFHSSYSCRDRSFTNFLAGDTPPAVQVESISDNGIQLAGLIITGPCILLEGKVFLWDVPSLDLSARTTEDRWKGWNEKRFNLFEVVAPRPELLVLGTGKTLVQPPSVLRECLRKFGIQLDVMDTRNACSTYNLLTEEGRRVAAALLPLSPHPWKKAIGNESRV